MALTVLKVKNAKPGRHVDGRGLCLVVKPSGARTWVLCMQLKGHRRDYRSLAPAVSIAVRTPAPLWLPRLSMITVSPGLSSGTRT